MKRGSFYVGSTPNPRRRLRQHNGLAKGGAWRTHDRNNVKYRPWNMVCLVTGFPSRIAALQFEWAWQNVHLTRHISSEDRPPRKTVMRRNRKGGFKRKIQRPRYTLVERVQSLHLLLRAKSFARWPLHVRFFAADVYLAWNKYCKQTIRQPLRSITVSLAKTHPPPSSSKLTDDLPSPDAAPEKPMGIDALVVDYAPLKPLVQKSLVLLESPIARSCDICQQPVDPKSDLILLCSSEECTMTSHLTCLSQHFLSTETNQHTILPIEGSCPRCKQHLAWKTLLYELTLRTRGEQEISKLLKEPRKRKTGGTAKPVKSKSKGAVLAADIQNSTGAADAMVEDEEEEEEEEELSEDELMYRERVGDNDDDDVSVASSDSDMSIESAATKLPALHAQSSSPTKAKSIPAVIANSDWDDIDEIED